MPCPDGSGLARTCGKLTANRDGGIAKNPYLSFWLLDSQVGDTVKISWLDSQGESASREIQLS